MLLSNQVKIENSFNKYFLKSYLLYCTITSVVILTYFLFAQFNTNELSNIQNFLLPKLGWFYFSILLLSVASLVFFRGFTPKWIFSHADKKLYFDIFIISITILSYIPFSFLTYSYIISYFHIYAIYGSYFAIFMQIPNFLASIFINFYEGYYSTGFLLLFFSIIRFISPILLFFSYPAPLKNTAHNTNENNLSVV